MELLNLLLHKYIFFNSKLYVVCKHISFVCLISALDPKETTSMNGGQLYWGPQDLCMKEACSFLISPFHQTIRLNPPRSVWCIYLFLAMCIVCVHAECMLRDVYLLCWCKQLPRVSSKETNGRHYTLFLHLGFHPFHCSSSLSLLCSTENAMSYGSNGKVGLDTGRGGCHICRTLLPEQLGCSHEAQRNCSNINKIHMEIFWGLGG